MRRSPGDDGFTLAEILIASAILGISLVPLFLMQSAALGGARSSRPALMATAVAAEVADQLRTLPFSCLPTAQPLEFQVGERSPVSTQPVCLPGPACIPLALGAYPFDARVSVQVELLEPAQRLARLTVAVAWKGDGGGAGNEYRHVELIDNRKAGDGGE